MGLLKKINSNGYSTMKNWNEVDLFVDSMVKIS